MLRRVHLSLSFRFGVDVGVGAIRITVASLAETARLRSDLAAQDIHSVGRYGGWTYCSIEDNLIEARELA